MRRVKNLPTKEKITEVARELFAEKGLNGVSVRDIAKKAGVNVASINYYFNSKIRLYEEILKDGYIYLNSRIEELVSGNEKDFVDVSVEMFKILIEYRFGVRDFFKMMMSTDGEDILPFSTIPNINTSQTMMPGGDALLLKLSKELGVDITNESLLWGVRIIFSCMMHSVLMLNCDNAQIKSKCTLEQKELLISIKRLSKTILNQLKEEKLEGKL